MFSSREVGTRIALGFATVIAFLIGMGGFAILQLGKVNTAPTPSSLRKLT